MELYEQRKISKPKFAFYLTNTDETSYIDIGEFQVGSMRNPEKYVELDVINQEAWWTNNIDGIAFDGTEYSLPVVPAMTDTGTSCTHIPE